MTESLQILITALVGASLTAVTLAVGFAAAMAALWRCRRQRDAAREQARYHADRAEHLVAELDDITERTRPAAAALLCPDDPTARWSDRLLAEIRALPETPVTWPVIPGSDGPEASR